MTITVCLWLRNELMALGAFYKVIGEVREIYSRSFYWLMQSHPSNLLYLIPSCRHVTRHNLFFGGKDQIWGQLLTLLCIS